METTVCQGADWRKSTRSSSGGECVEVAFSGAVRDSKDPAGPVLSIKSGTFDR